MGRAKRSAREGECGVGERAGEPEWAESGWGGGEKRGRARERERHGP
jgi:hypothetical protein